MKFTIFCLFTSFLSGTLGYPSRPVIGILLQEESTQGCGDKPYQVFVSYKKYIEQAGGATIPIFVNQSLEYYQKIMARINGILFPGGDADIVASSYGEAARLLMRAAVVYNLNDIRFPVWGTCLGMQVMTTIPFEKPQNVLSRCSGTEDISLPLNFTDQAAGSSLYGSIPSDLLHILSTENVTANYHQYCLSLMTYNNSSALQGTFKVTSTNKDAQGLEFVSSMEAYGFPFYGVQWHPEKNNFWFVSGSSITHSSEAVRVSQYFANFLVDAARNSINSFPTFADEARFLFNNYPTLYEKATQLEYYCLDDEDIPPF